MKFDLNHYSFILYYKMDLKNIDQNKISEPKQKEPKSSSFEDESHELNVDDIMVVNKAEKWKEVDVSPVSYEKKQLDQAKQKDGLIELKEIDGENEKSQTNQENGHSKNMDPQHQTVNGV